MNQLPPLEWAYGTLTGAHYVIWAAFFFLCLLLVPKRKRPMPVIVRIWCGIFLLPISYCMVAPVVGQVFGDRLAWSQLWPSGLLLGAVLSTFVIVGMAPAFWSEPSRRLELSVFAALCVAIAAGFFGVFFAFIWWSFPIWIGLWPFDIPQQVWGMQIQGCLDSSGNFASESLHEHRTTQAVTGEHT